LDVVFIPMLTDNFFPPNESRNSKRSRNTVLGADHYRFGSLFKIIDNLMKEKKINKLIIGL